MSVIDHSAGRAANPWREEARAMLVLAWPMILNLAQTAMTATDVMIIGRLSADHWLPARWVQPLFRAADFRP
jgi:MATE family multidrug resistance protein